MADHADPVSSSLEVLLARFGERVRQAGRRFGLRDADVDEVVQDVRIRLWRALASGEAIARAPGSYVYRTATSAALDLLRRRRGRHETGFDPGTDLPEPALQAPATAERALADTEIAARVAVAVDSLVESRRAVVRMWLAGFDLREIMHAFGQTEPKARNLLYRGLADLRARLTEMGIGPEALP